MESPMTLPEALVTLAALKAGLEQVGIEYMVVGSLASSVHGLPRATRDADLLVLMDRGHAARLAEALGSAFYMSEEAAKDAIVHGTSFNAIHEETFFQVDLFVMKPSPFNQLQLERRQYIALDPNGEIVFPFQSAEDTILSKLDWFRQGNEVSERQWQDVVGILRTQGAQLDREYLRRWAASIGVDGLLQRALEECWPQSDMPETEQ
mgnify:CR=1 FL=1